MRIKKLSLWNFKGVLNFTLDLEEGKNCSVFGDNATGKSTLFDAFTFLFFGKDSLGKSDFEIKTISDGAVVPMLDHSVGGIFDIDGKEVALLKTYREKYTKKRGSVEQVFDGHETDYYIDRVPKTKGEYQKFIAEIAPEELFRLLTSPTHFNEGMKWQDRRSILLQVCGNVTDSAVIAAHPELHELGGLKRTIEDEKKVVMAERKKINDDLQMIPARIDEATKALPGAVGVSAESLMLKAKKASGELADLQQAKSTIENGGAVALKRKELAEIETAIINLKNKHAAVDHGKADREAMGELQRQLSEAIGFSIQEMAAGRRFEDLLSSLTTENKGIVDRWHSEKSKVFLRGGACQTCGQDYPENLLDMQEADFNRARARAIEKITEEGTANAAAIKGVKESIEKHATEFFTAEQNKALVESKIEELQKAIDSRQQAPGITELPEYKDLEAQKKVIEAELAVQSCDAVTLAISAVDQKILTKQTEINEINQQITAIEMRRSGEARIEELKAQEKSLAKQFEKHEAQLFLLEKFTRAKVSMLDESINSRFSIVKFKLFDEQINGGLSECCTCTVNGVEYGSVNNGHKIRAGADIVSVMQKHYGLSVPVFFDNRESVTSLPPMECQTISLIVSKPDKAIRVELQ
jgi:DNA repair exonuclease SbcCD ATPase subunit